MKDISFYFKPHAIDAPSAITDQLGSYILRHDEYGFPQLNKKGVAIFFVPEYRNSLYNADSSCSPVIQRFANLYKGNQWDFAIYDLGIVEPGATILDTYHAIQSIIEELVRNKILPIVIGGTQDLTYALYKGYENLEQLVNICAVDTRLDLGDIESEITHEGWLNKIILHKPCYLFNFSNIGGQSHYIAPSEFELFEKLYFDSIRYGQLSDDITLCEPTFRNADIVSFDLNSIRAHEIGGKHYQSPNGFSAQEACRIARYAGISDKVTSVGIFNFYSNDLSPAGEELIAQLLWYAIEGYANRKGDFPIGKKSSYIKYHVTFDQDGQELLFLKSDKSGRWWMEVPYPAIKGQKFERHHLVPCTYNDYQEAMKGNIPDLWWRTHQKLG
jgi:formiminoglutamase